MVKVFAIHTAFALVEPLTVLFKENLPGVKLNHIVDDSLIQEVIASNNTVTNQVRKRLLNYYISAVDAGADIIFNVCSSVGDVAETGRTIVSIPLLRIDDPMAIEAVKTGKRIGVLGTLPTSLGPTASLLKRKALELNKEVELVEGLAEGAFEAVMSGDKETHDNLILKASEKIADKVDLIVLTQGSMAHMEQKLAEVSGKRVLSSPLSGVLGVKEFMKTNGLI